MKEKIIEKEHVRETTAGTTREAKESRIISAMDEIKTQSDTIIDILYTILCK